MRTNRHHLTGLAILLIASLLMAACGGLGAPGTAAFSQDEAGFPTSDGPVAPEWALETLDGGSFQHTDHQGDVVVMFFMASWCSSCVLEARALAQLHDKYADQGLTVVAVNMEPEKNHDALTQFRMLSGEGSYIWVFDDQYQVSQLYDVKALDSTIIIDRAGRIAYRDTFITPFGDLEAEVQKWL